MSASFAKPVMGLVLDRRETCVHVGFLLYTCGVMTPYHSGARMGVIYIYDLAPAHSQLRLELRYEW